MSTPSLVGTWRLVSMTSADGAGGWRPYWGDRPSGLLVYTASGHVAAQVYDARRPPLQMPWESVPADVARAAFLGLATYFGRYSVDGPAGLVTHHVEGAMAPDWIGHDLVRAFRFLDRDRLELSVVKDGRVTIDGLVLVWERVE